MRASSFSEINVATVANAVATTPTASASGVADVAASLATLGYETYGLFMRRLRDCDDNDTRVDKSDEHFYCRCYD